MNKINLLYEIKFNQKDTIKKTCGKICSCFCVWFLNFGLWALIIRAIFNRELPVIIYGCMFYVLYLFAELCDSPILKSLRNISNQTIDEIIENLIKGKPNIYLVGESYHMENNHGGAHECITFSEGLLYNYAFCRDISGLLILNTDISDIKGKYYIKLKIINKIYLADDKSIAHYGSLKDLILLNNRNRDKKFRFFNHVDIEGFPNSFLIKLNDEEPWFIGNGFWFVIFTLFTFAELYKIYLNLLILRQTFYIKKVISISYDVNTDPRFNIFNPKFCIKHTNQHFQYNELNNNSVNLLNEQINEMGDGNINVLNVIRNENRNNRQNNINQEEEDTNVSLSDEVNN